MRHTHIFRFHFARIFAFAALLAAAPAATAIAKPAAKPAAAPPPVVAKVVTEDVNLAPVLAALSPQGREKLTAQPILFVTRRQYTSGHHNTETFFPAAKHERNDGRFIPGGALKILDFKTGKLTTLIETATGLVRDPEVHFSGKRILFSMRQNAADSYHIYEINADGTGLKQLTFVQDADDLDPFYLADDHIGFSSTREPKYCGCNRHIMANLYRMEPDGANIHQISKNTLFDGHGILMPDGRILYDRWEYVDRNYGDAQGLWTCNPDGTKHEIYWGNNTPAPGAVIDARPIPGTDKTVCVFSSCHDRPWGAVAIIDRKRGLEGPAPVIRTWPAAAAKRVWETDQMPSYWGIDTMARLPVKYEDPHPFSEKLILCSRRLSASSRAEKTGLFLLEDGGAETLLYQTAGDLGCYDPAPLAPHPRPPLRPAQREYTGATGSFYVLDVYQGTHMKGIKRGDVKYLRVVETPEKRFWSGDGWHGQGSVGPAIGWDDFMVKKILGTVPVEADGSAYFEAPAEKFVYFQLLDKDGLMLHSMRSGTIVQPGEKNGCVGCHDDRLAAVPPGAGFANIFKRKPAKLTPWQGKPAHEFSYRAEVQPVWDKYCASCHNPEKPAGKKLNLTGGAGMVFNPSYAELWAKRYIKPVGAGPARILQAREWGSTQSKIVPLLRKKHGGVHLEKDDPAAFERIITWIDINAPYYPSFATSYPDNPHARSPLSHGELKELEKVLGRRVSVHVRDHGNIFLDVNQGKPWKRDLDLIPASTNLNFDAPEKSPVLAGLKEKDPAQYAKALEIIQRGAARVRANGDNGLAGFKPCKTDIWRENKYLDRLHREQASRRAIAEGRKLYDNQPVPN
jgi:hypothetical protein